MPLTSLRPVALTVITGLATVVCLRAIILHIPAFQYVHTECDTRSLLSSACFVICLSLCLDFVYFKICATKKMFVLILTQFIIEVVIEFFPLFSSFLFVKVFLHMNVITLMSPLL